MSESNAFEELCNAGIPEHLAIIMDGNGRWARQRGQHRVFGHKNGVEAVRRVIENSARLGVKYLTLYAFSTENWKRPKTEVDTLMRLLVTSLRKEFNTLNQNNIRLKAIGRLDALPERVSKELEESIQMMSENTGMTLTIALSYGAREELTSAMQAMALKVKNNIISPDDIDDAIINNHLYTHDLPDVDLLIRTSGEQRVSNFLLWQIAYAELYFTEVLWPDFDAEHLFDAIRNYQNRERRFGKTSEQLIQ
jgi:undecaprenyl diphosphate synthase